MQEHSEGYQWEKMTEAGNCLGLFNKAISKPNPKTYVVNLEICLCFSSFLSFYHGKAAAALYFGRIRTRLEVMQFPTFPAVA